MTCIVIDIEGQRFGRLTAIEHQEKQRWLCVCDCGGVKTTESYSLRKGLTQSCGCLHKEQTSKARRRHGQSRNPTWVTWSNLRQRCFNPHDKGYKNYGGRGIGIAPRWDSYENFFADMGPRAPGMTIERLDVNGDYAPDNCCWIPKGEQSKNRRPSHLWTRRK